MIDGKSLWWSVHGRNKKCITLNLKSSAARAAVLDLVRDCDVVVENFRPGQLTRLGLGPDVLRGVNSRLIIAQISGYGQTGPDRDRASFGVIGEAVGGLRYLTNHAPGTSDLPPVRVGVSIGDSLAGLYAALGVVAALWQRDRAGGDGQPRTLDVALTESVLSMMEGLLPEYGALGNIKEPTGGGIATAAPTNAYPTGDGSWALIAANSEPIFARLMHLIGQAELIGEPGYRNNAERVGRAAQLDALIAEWTRRFAAADLLVMLEEKDIPASKAYNAADCATDRQYRARAMVRDVYDPAFGQNILHAGIVPHVVEGPGGVRWPGPSIGAHNEEVLGGMLGRSAEQIAEMTGEHRG